MKRKHRICEHCGATLDPEERCDCQEKDDNEEKKDTGGKPKAAA